MFVKINVEKEEQEENKPNQSFCVYSSEQGNGLCLLKITVKSKNKERWVVCFFVKTFKTEENVNPPTIRTNDKSAKRIASSLEHLQNMCTDTFECQPTFAASYIARRHLCPPLQGERVRRQRTGRRKPTLPLAVGVHIIGRSNARLSSCPGPSPRTMWM